MQQQKKRPTRGSNGSANSCSSIHSGEEGFYADAPEDTLVMFIVYKHPEDFPNQFVARRWEIGRGTAQPTPFFVARDSLYDLHAALPRSLVMMPRMPGDDPAIQEVWL